MVGQDHGKHCLEEQAALRECEIAAVKNAPLRSAPLLLEAAKARKWRENVPAGFARVCTKSLLVPEEKTAARQGLQAAEVRGAATDTRLEQLPPCSFNRKKH